MLIIEVGCRRNAPQCVNKLKLTAKPVVLSCMTKEELIKEMATRAGIPQKTVAGVLASFLDIVGEQLAQGNPVVLIGFGTFKPKKLAARNCNNPNTGEVMELPERIVPNFVAGDKLKKTVKEGSSVTSISKAGTKKRKAS